MRAKNNLAISSLNFVLVDLIGNFLYWPLWWYSKGLVKTGLFCLYNLKEEYERLAIGVWLKNIFTPMFGQYDREGRLISFFVRLLQIIVRSVFLLLWALFLMIIFLIWILLPIYISYQALDNFFWLFR